MSDEDYGKVFRSLFTTKKVGHGFNLLTVKRVIKFHGGKISAVKRPDGGACFAFELPCRQGVEQTKKL
jgi:signal transduction histidine kinase